VDFPAGGQKDFSNAGEAVVKFHFTNSKLSEKYFSTKTLIGKYQISNSKGSKGPLAPPSDAHI